MTWTIGAVEALLEIVRTGVVGNRDLRRLGVTNDQILEEVAAFAEGDEVDAGCVARWESHWTDTEKY